LTLKERLQSLGIEQCDDFEETFMSIINASGEVNFIIDKLLVFSKMVVTTPWGFLCKHKKFEKLTDYENLYSIHIDTKSFNIRVLYSYIGQKGILLHAFNEQDKKYATGYKKNAKTALKLREEFLYK
jgi:hypothetical protein